MRIQIKRVYDPIEDSDGYRVLVDRLWPRGIKKEALHPDYWARELAPSTEARKEFGHKAENFQSFKAKYLMELDSRPDAIDCAKQILDSAKEQGDDTITLLYAAKDPNINHAIILKGWLEETLSIAS